MAEKYYIAISENQEKLIFQNSLDFMQLFYFSCLPSQIALSHEHSIFYIVSGVIWYMALLYADHKIEMPVLLLKNNKTNKRCETHTKKIVYLPKSK